MTLFKWNERYKTGLVIIDERHKKLFELINDLYEYNIVNSRKEIIDKQLKELLEYIFQQFKTEEELLAKHKYPDFRLHRTEHDSLTKNLMELRGRYHTGNTFVITEIITFLNNWLIIHILQSDMKFAKYLEVNFNSIR